MITNLERNYNKLKKSMRKKILFENKTDCRTFETKSSKTQIILNLQRYYTKFLFLRQMTASKLNKSLQPSFAWVPQVIPYSHPVPIYSLKRPDEKTDPFCKRSKKKLASLVRIASAGMRPPVYPITNTLKTPTHANRSILLIFEGRKRPLPERGWKTGQRLDVSWRRDVLLSRTSESSDFRAETLWHVVIGAKRHRVFGFLISK